MNISQVYSIILHLNPSNVQPFSLISHDHKAEFHDYPIKTEISSTLSDSLQAQPIRIQVFSHMITMQQPQLPAAPQTVKE